MINKIAMMIKRKLTYPLMVIISFVMISSCHPLFCRWGLGYKRIEQLPSNDSIIGTYNLTIESTKFLQKKGFNGNCKLILSDSNLFSLINAPDLIFNIMGRNNGEVIDKNGKWRVSCCDSYDCLIELEGVAVIPIARKDNGPISILYTIGDGDSCEGIIFEHADN